ncbi:unnamed protein product [Rotaria sordida]|nr:unnamed protein product [Rotaria sordida]
MDPSLLCLVTSFSSNEAVTRIKNVLLKQQTSVPEANKTCMPIENTDHNVNLGYERKRKKIEDKIPKSGGKRPRQCDKENNYSSPYFTSNNNNTSIANKTHE